MTFSIYYLKFNLMSSCVTCFCYILKFSNNLRIRDIIVKKLAFMPPKICN